MRNVNKYCVNLALIILKITLKKILLFLILLSFSCNTGNLTVIADLPSSLKEVSAAETTTFSDLLWVIEDAGNKNRLYGLNEKGEIKREIKISNAKNKDWEDLTSDIEGNIYIGDFGDNHKKRKKYRILKVKHPKKKTTKITPKHINFTLPIDIKSLDFEAFFLLNDFFYLFSKNEKHGKLFKVPNTVENHEAIFMTNFNLKGKNNKITSAAISNDNKTIALLNHDKVWLITNFKNDDFFKGDIRVLEFNHDSQKEGVCFKNDSTLYITDEKSHGKGGNLYELKIE